MMKWEGCGRNQFQPICKYCSVFSFKEWEKSQQSSVGPEIESGTFRIWSRIWTLSTFGVPKEREKARDILQMLKRSARCGLTIEFELEFSTNHTASFYFAIFLYSVILNSVAYRPFLCWTTQFLCSLKMFTVETTWLT